MNATHTPALNATALRDFVATCGHPVKKGERIMWRRERALSMRHASHAGTMYPASKYCAACAAARAALAKAGAA